MRANHHSRISSAKITYRTLPSDPDKMSKRTPSNISVRLHLQKFFGPFHVPRWFFVNQNHGKIRMFWDDSNSWFEDSKGWPWFTHILTLLASQALQIWKWNILKYCDFVGGGHEKDFCNCAISRIFDKHCLHTSCLSRTARHWSGSTLCGRDSFFLDSGSEQRLIRKWP